MKLTVAELNKLDKVINKTKTIKILDNKYEINIHTVFKKGDIEDLLLNYMTILQELQTAPNANLKNTYSIFITLTLRQFTDLPIPKGNDITELIKITKVLLNNGITMEVFNQLPQEQVDYLNQRVKESSEALGKLFDSQAKEVNSIGHTEPEATRIDSEEENS